VEAFFGVLAVCLVLATLRKNIESLMIGILGEIQLEKVSI